MITGLIGHREGHPHHIFDDVERRLSEHALSVLDAKGGDTASMCAYLHKNKGTAFAADRQARCRRHFREESGW